MSGANREYVDRTCLHDEVCIYREEHMRKGAERMRKGAERMNKSRVTEYILAYMQEKEFQHLRSQNRHKFRKKNCIRIIKNLCLPKSF